MALGEQAVAVAMGYVKLERQVGGDWVVKGFERRVQSVNFLLQTVRGPEVYKAGLRHSILRLCGSPVYVLSFLAVLGTNGTTICIGAS